jgi:hypothetical protein
MFFVMGEVPHFALDRAAEIPCKVQSGLPSLLLVMLQNFSHEDGFGTIGAPGLLLQPG